MTVIIGTGAGALRTYLEENGIRAAAYRCEEVPSLTALLLQLPNICSIVLFQGDIEWSMGHILAAAKQLQHRGRMVIFGADAVPSSLTHVAASKEDLLRLLKSSVKGAASDNGGRTLLRADTPPVIPPEVPKISPMKIPPSKLLLLGIVGSQQRIGCTTQAISLWHYCKALGFDPAIVASPEQLAAIAAPMQKEEIPGGYRIEGIPFVTNTTHIYDCYLLDVGAGNIQEVQNYADHTILVAGSKPWELQHTAAALRALRGKELSVLLSFCSEKDAKSLQPLFGSLTPAVMPWAPELWAPNLAAMVILDGLLRPAIAQILAKEDAQIEPEEENQPSKGD